MYQEEKMMEDNRGLRTYLGPAIRIAVLVIVVGVIAFFIVRWARNRNTNTTESTTQTAQNADRAEDNIRDEEPEAESVGDSSSSTNNNSTTAQSPSATDNNRAVPNTGATAIPETGMGESILMTGALISLSVYLIVKYYLFSADSFTQ